MPVEKLVLERFDEVADLYDAGLFLEELERVDELSATRYEDAFAVSH